MSLASASSWMVVHCCVHASFLKEEMNFKIATFFLPPNIIEENSYMEYIKYRWKQYLLYYGRVGYGQWSKALHLDDVKVDFSNFFNWILQPMWDYFWK